MTEAYYTENQKLLRPKRVPWTFTDCETIQAILTNKGYPANCVSRIACDRQAHDSLQVEREDMPQLIEQLFRQRLVAEVQAEGHGKAAIIFSYDYRADTIISAVNRFQHKKEEED